MHLKAVVSVGVLLALVASPTTAQVPLTPSDTVHVWSLLDAHEGSAREAFETAWRGESRVISFSRPPGADSLYTYTFDRLSRLADGVGRDIVIEEGVTVTVADYEGADAEREYTAANVRGVLSLVECQDIRVVIHGRIDANARPGHVPLSPRGSEWEDSAEEGGDTDLRSHHAIHIVEGENIEVLGGEVTNAWFAVFAAGTDGLRVEGLRFLSHSEPAAGPRRQRADGTWIGGYANAAVALRDVSEATLTDVSAKGSSEVVDLNAIGYPITMTGIAGEEIWEAVIETSGAPGYWIEGVSGVNSRSLLSLKPYEGLQAYGDVHGALAIYTADAPAWLADQGVVPFEVYSHVTLTDARVEIGAGVDYVQQVLRQAEYGAGHASASSSDVQLAVRAEPDASFASGDGVGSGAGRHRELVYQNGGHLRLDYVGPVGEGQHLVWTDGADGLEVTAVNTVGGGAAGTLIGAATAQGRSVHYTLGAVDGFADTLRVDPFSHLDGPLGSTASAHRPHDAPAVQVAAYPVQAGALTDGAPVALWQNRGQKAYAHGEGGLPIGSGGTYREGIGLELGEGAGWDWGRLKGSEADFGEHRLTLRFRVSGDAAEGRRLVAFGGAAPYRIETVAGGLDLRFADDPTVHVPLALTPGVWYVLTFGIDGSEGWVEVGPEYAAPEHHAFTLSSPLARARGSISIGSDANGGAAPGTMWVSHLVIASGEGSLDTASEDAAVFAREIAPAPAPIAPMGVTASPVCFSWASSGASGHMIRVMTASGEGVGSYHAEAAERCLGPLESLAAGDYSWNIVALHEAGASGVSEALAFTVGEATPVVTEREISGPAGWRVVAVPSAGMTVADLAGQSLVAGVPGYYEGFGEPTLFTGYDGRNWQPPAAPDEALPLGVGFYWYFHDEDFTPEGAASQPSRARELPLLLTTDLPPNRGDVTVPLYTNASRANVLGNPFGFPLDLSGTRTWDGGRDLAGNARVYVWDARRNRWKSNETVVGPWEGFAVRAKRSAQTLTIPASAQLVPTSSRAKHPPQATPTPRLVLSATSADGRREVSDEIRLHEQGAEAPAVKLDPLAGPFVGLGVAGWDEGAAVFLEDATLPGEEAEITLPLGIRSAGTEAVLRLEWADPLPAGWHAELVRHADGRRQPLAAGAGVPVETTADGDWATGYALRLYRDAATTASPDLVGAPWPNPAGDRARLPLHLEQDTHVRAEIFDVLGRSVAIVHDGPLDAGAHVLDLDTRQLAPGTYTVVVSGVETVQARRLTVVE